MPKTIDALAASRTARADIIDRLGCVPESIMTYDRTDKAIDIHATKRNYAATGNDGGHTGALATVFDVSGQACTAGALSRFPQNIGRTLVQWFTNENDTVVDPFAGHNSRMELCWRIRRHYIGVDISAAFMDANGTIKQQLEQRRDDDLFPEHFTATIRLVRADSTALPLRDAIGDMTITSPPYWDLEHYGDEPGQLGDRTYGEFLEALSRVARENHRVLKPGAYCVWFVNDFRKGGRFFPYHEHTAHILRNAGFEQHDTIIVDLGPAISATFATQIYERRATAKRHEYALVFRKPSHTAASAHGGQTV